MNTNQNQPPAGQTILFNATLFFAIITFLGAFGYGIASNMSDYAKLVIGVVAVTLVIVLPFCALVIAIMRRSAPNTQAVISDIRVIEPDDDEPKPPRQIASPQPQQQPRYQLPQAYHEEYPHPAQYAPQMQYRPPAQREVFIPRVSNMGQTVPYGYQAPPPAAQPTLLKTSDATGQRIEIDERILSRFLACKTPSRSEWTGAKEGYTRAAAFCIEQGLCTRLPNGGLQWCAEFANEDTRLEWAQSITQ